jgi:hypothetical protein
VVTIEGHLDGFAPLPVLAAYFDRLLALLAARHIETDFVAVPLNASTWRAVRPALRDGFASYLAGYAARYPNFHIIGPLMPAWDDGWFGDEFAHLNPASAALFGALRRLPAGLACRGAKRRARGGSNEASDVGCATFDQPRLQDAPPSTQNAAQWGWFSATGRDASAKVAPISKRGS